MRRAHSLRWRLTLAMLLVFVLGLATSIVISTQETRQEESVGLQESADGALVGIVLDEALDSLLVFAPLAVVSFALIWVSAGGACAHLPARRGKPRRSDR